MAPLIGLNVDVNVDKPTELRVARSYCEAVQTARGSSILIPPMPRKQAKGLLRNLGGALFIGGRDYSPESYGKKPDKGQPLNPLHPDRQAFDLMLMELALELDDLPILAICGGEQLLNIALGGTLVQHIPSAYPQSKIAHRGEGKPAYHPVSIEKGSRLAKIYRLLRLPEVVSSHHESVDRLGDGLVEVAWSDDGVVEAIELPGGRFVIGVQWHPERDIEGNMRLFNAFIRAARKHAGEK